MKKAILVTLTLCYICGILCSCNSNTAQITYDSTNTFSSKFTTTAKKIYVNDNEISDSQEQCSKSQEAVRELMKDKKISSNAKKIYSEIEKHNLSMQNDEYAKEKLSRDKVILEKAQELNLIVSKDEYINMQKEQYNTLKKCAADSSSDAYDDSKIMVDYYNKLMQIEGISEEKLIENIAETMMNYGAKSKLLNYYATQNHLDKSDSKTNDAFEKYVDELIQTNTAK